MKNAGLKESQAGIKTKGRNINNLRYVNDTTLMAESKEELKSLLMKVRGEWKAGINLILKNEDHDIWSHHFMPNRWGNNGNSERIYLGVGGSKITADGDCSHEIKRCLLLGRKIMTNLDNILKSIDITLPTKVHLEKLWFFQGFPYTSIGKESACNAGDSGSIPGSGWSTGKGIGYPLQYPDLENSMDCIVHGVAKSWTRLNFPFHFYIDGRVGP